ncbi:hypothetical protein EGW08_017916, partial [Elysia chlorotica]
MDDDVDDRYAGIDIDSLLNRNDTRRALSYGRKKALYEAPEFLVRLNGEETIMEGQALCLECKVQGFPVPTLRWYKDDEEIIDHPRIKVQSDGKGAYALLIDNVMRGDEAAYRCRAENVEGACSSVFFLSVRAKPKNSKKDPQRSPNRRTVSFPPMFSTIVEKVEEEEKQGKEFEMLPPSPLTDCYYALTLKSRATWPTFLGDWAFKNGNRRGSDAEMLPNGDAQGAQSPSEGRENARKNLRRSDLTARVQAKKQRLDEERKQREEEERQAAQRKNDGEKSEEEKEQEEVRRKLKEKKEEERKLETKLILEREERRRKRAELERESAEKEEAMRKRREARAERLERERREKEEEEEQWRKQQEEDEKRRQAVEKLRKEEEERLKQELLEKRRIEEEEARWKKQEDKRKEEEEKKKEEEQKKHLEQKRIEEEKKKKEEEEKKKQVEEKRKEEERQKKEEEQKRQAEEERKKQLEQKKKEEERKKKQEEEDLQRKQIEQKKKEDEEKRKGSNLAPKRAENGIGGKMHSQLDINKKIGGDEKPGLSAGDLTNRKPPTVTDNKQGTNKPKPKAFQMFQEKVEEKPKPASALVNKPKPGVLSRFQDKFESKPATATV